MFKIINGFIIFFLFFLNMKINYLTYNLIVFLFIFPFNFFNTKNVINMNNILEKYTYLISLNLSYFNTNNLLI